MSRVRQVRLRLIHAPEPEDIVREIVGLGYPQEDARNAASDFRYRVLRVDNLEIGTACGMQELIRSRGGCALASRGPSKGDGAVDLLVGAADSVLHFVVSVLEEQVEGGGGLGARIFTLLKQDGPLRRLTVKGRVFDFSQRAYIMGVLNCTPDSFSDGGRYLGPDAALAQARRMLAEGADVIDVGGESTRPGASPVPAEEELARVIPVIKEIAAQPDVCVSIDTTKAVVAREAIAAGASMVNDVSGLTSDPALAAVVAESAVPVVLMHMRGTPQTMQQCTEYDDLMGEIIEYLRERIAVAEAAGIRRDQIIVDPGIGFGKSIERDNCTILRNLGEIRALGRPILVGPSRKGFLGRLVDLPAGERDCATAGAVAAAVLNGADLVRVHNVGIMRQVVAVVDAIKRAAPGKAVSSEQ